MRFRKLLSSFFFVCLLSPALVLQTQAGPLETIQTKIAQYLKRPGARSAHWGIQILDPAADKVLIEVNPDKTFLPASVLKVVTTSTALEKLGPDFRYRTGVYTNGTVEADGTVSQDVILVGRGDPNLTDPYGELLEKPAFLELSEQLKNAGVKKIKGDIVGDDSYFDSTSHGKGWTANDLKSIYGAPINALSINNNVLWIFAHPGKRGKPVSIDTEPRTSYFHIRNLGVTGSRQSKRTIHARVIPGTKTIVVSGVLPFYQGFQPLRSPGETCRSGGYTAQGSVGESRDCGFRPCCRLSHGRRFKRGTAPLEFAGRAPVASVDSRAANYKQEKSESARRDVASDFGSGV